MKKVIFAVAFVLTAIASFAQSEDFTKFKLLWGPLGVNIRYDQNMVPQSHTFSLCFQNAEYRTLEDLFIYKTGSAQDIFDSLAFIEEFAIKVTENGVSTKHGDIMLTRLKMPLLADYVNVDLGEKSFDIALFAIKKIKKTLTKYCKQNNLQVPIDSLTK